MLDLEEGKTLLSHHVDGLEVTCDVRQVPLLMKNDVATVVGRDGQPESACFLERELKRLKSATVQQDDPDRWVWEDGGASEPVRMLHTPPRAGHAFALETSDWILLISPSRSVLPRISFQLRADFLLRLGGLPAFKSIRAWAEDNLLWRINGVPPGESPIWRVSRLDLAADIAGVEFTPGDLERFTTRALTKRNYYSKVGGAVEHFQGRTFTGITVGKRGSPLYARIYLKSREAPTTALVRGVWKERLPSLERSDPVWRVEFEVRRSLLRDLRRQDGTTLEPNPEENLGAHLDDLWVYAMQWLVLRTDHGSKRISRREVDPWWNALAQVRGLSGEVGKPKHLARRPARAARAENQLDRALSSLVGYSATSGINELDVALADLHEFAEHKGGSKSFIRRVNRRRGSET